MITEEDCIAYYPYFNSTDSCTGPETTPDTSHLITRTHLSSVLCPVSFVGIVDYLYLCCAPAIYSSGHLQFLSPSCLQVLSVCLSCASLLTRCVLQSICSAQVIHDLLHLLGKDILLFISPSHIAFSFFMAYLIITGFVFHFWNCLVVGLV